MLRIVIDQMGNTMSTKDRIKWGHISDRPVDRDTDAVFTAGHYYWTLADHVHDWFEAYKIPYKMDFNDSTDDWIVQVNTSDKRLALLVKLTWGGK